MTLFFAAATSEAYSIQAHRRMSLEASNISVMAEDTTYELLGIHASDIFPLGGSGSSMTPAALVQLGAEQEDGGRRPANHFFDPQNGGRELTPCNILCNIPLQSFCGNDHLLCHPSPRWALEDDEPVSEQDYSLVDARDQMFKALTETDNFKRDTAFGQMFQMLGHVIHHVQDMAQPQHTRNSRHFFFALFENTADVLLANQPSSFFTSYGPAVEFDPGSGPVTARQYWSTQMSPATGLADFSSLNFVTSETNFSGTPSAPVANAEYPAPSGSGVTTRAVTIAQLLADGEITTGTPTGDQLTLSKTIILLDSPIVDELVGASYVAPIATYSTLTQDLLQSGGDTPRFAVTSVNVEAAVRLLVPRAVSYSAGLINYYFRTVANPAGDPALRFSASDWGDPARGEITITNNTLEDFSTGTVQVFYDNASGVRKDAGVGVLVTIPAGQSVTLARSNALRLDEVIREGSVDGEVVVTYRGSIGGEANAVSGRICKCPAEPIPGPPSDPNFDPGNSRYDCVGVCGCQYLALPQGNPGLPGDGVTVPPMVLGPFHFLDGHVEYNGYTNIDSSLIRLGQSEFQDGATVTVFRDPSYPGSYHYNPYQVNFYENGASQCVAINYLGGSVSMAPSAGGSGNVEGRYTSFPRASFDCEPGSEDTPLSQVSLCGMTSDPPGTPQCEDPQDPNAFAPLDAILICAGTDRAF